MQRELFYCGIFQQKKAPFGAFHFIQQRLNHLSFFSFSLAFQQVLLQLTQLLLTVQERLLQSCSEARHLLVRHKHHHRLCKQNDGGPQ